MLFRNYSTIKIFFFLVLYNSCLIFSTIYPNIATENGYNGKDRSIFSTKKSVEIKLNFKNINNNKHHCKMITYFDSTKI